MSEPLPDPRTPAERRAIAHHEAGHCVAAHVLGLPLQAVDITFRRDEDGAIAGTAYLDCWAPIRGLDEATKRLASEQLVKRQIVMFLAGGAAQRQYAPRSRVRSFASRDLTQASELAALCGSVAGHGTLLRWATIEARELIRSHWHLVEPLAAALLEREKSGAT
jgi:ATP-dependent Zn protease